VQLAINNSLADCIVTGINLSQPSTEHCVRLKCIWNYISASFVESDVGGPVDPNELVPRRVGEVIGSTVGTLATLVNYPIGNIQLTFELLINL